MAAIDDIKALFDRASQENDEPRPHPGLSHEVISSRLGEIGVAPHALLLDLYSWHNGIDHLNAFLHFLPLDEAIRLHELYRRHDSTWKSTWFPALNINGSIAISLDVESDELLVEDIEGGERWLLANHYQDYINALRYAFDTGAAYYDSDGGAFEVGEEAWTSIARMHRVSDW